jgi:transcriptional regulator with XRE-family HTH domain
MSAIRKLREALGLSRPQFAALVGRSEATIEKYESEITDDLKEKLVALAEQHSLRSLALELKGEPVAEHQVGYPYFRTNRTLHDKLEAILNSGDQGVIGAVVPNIEIFFDRMRPPTTRRKLGNS